MIRARCNHEHVERALRNLCGEEQSEQEVLAQRTNQFCHEIDEINLRAQQDSVSNRTHARTFEWEAQELRVRLQWHEMELNMASQVVQAREHALNQVITVGKDFYCDVKNRAEAFAMEETRVRNQRIQNFHKEEVVLVNKTRAEMQQQYKDGLDRNAEKIAEYQRLHLKTTRENHQWKVKNERSSLYEQQIESL
eukprot:4778559-Amphidinium_carterae.2